MNPVLEHRPDFWHISLSGQIDDVERALKALKYYLKEAWGKAEPEWESDDDEAIASVRIRFIDISMVRLVNSILRSDHPHVRIKINGRRHFDEDADV